MRDAEVALALTDDSAHGLGGTAYSRSADPSLEALLLETRRSDDVLEVPIPAALYKR